MNPTPAKKPKAIKARVMWATAGLGYGNLSCLYNRPHHDEMTDANNPVVVLPATTLQQARALKRFFDLSEEEQVEALARKLSDRDGYSWSRLSLVDKDDYEDQARALRSMIYGITK